MRFKRIYIEITNKCNLSCSFCPKLKRASREMSTGEFYRAASQARGFCDYLYLHLKGEPLSHSQIDKILTICDELEFKVNITTNGTLLEKCKDTLKNHKSVRQINVSLHSMENIHAAEKYVKNIVDCARFLAPEKMISLRIWTYDNDASEINRKMLDILEKEFGTKPVLSEKRSTLAENIYFNLGDTFEWPSPLSADIGSTGFCLGTRSHIAILSDGTVVPCCLDSEGDIPLGNVFETDLETILNSMRFLEMYNGFSNRKIKESLCRKCSFRLRFDN